MKPDYLTEWEYFVIRHQSVGNIIFHHLSLIGPVVSLLLIFFTGSFWWLILLFATWTLGTLGHYLFEDGTVRGVDFVRVQTLYGLFRVTYMMLKGTYKEEVIRVKELIKTSGEPSLQKDFFTLK